MERPNFTPEQENWLCETIGEWYLLWKEKMTNHGEPHMLGIAKEQLKCMVVGEDFNAMIEELCKACDK